MHVGGVAACAGQYGVVQGSGRGRGTHWRLGAALVARCAVHGCARLRRLRGGGTRLGGSSAQLWGAWVVWNGSFEDDRW